MRVNFTMMRPSKIALIQRQIILRCFIRNISIGLRVSKIGGRRHALNFNFGSAALINIGLKW